MSFDFGGMPEGTWRSDHVAYLASPIWIRVRAGAIERAGGKCQRCGKTPRFFHVHHLTYERSGGNELPADLEALCPRCHQKAHNLSRKGRKKTKAEPRRKRIKMAVGKRKVFPKHPDYDKMLAELRRQLTP